ncbi:MAG TPA: hypothetical protein VHX14_19635 [Thermoanaerobaculia bacterium]|jgi:hypothetical protein|nr:hypothetical protein [Thermoanaerobaculia bacterium]
MDFVAVLLLVASLSGATALATTDRGAGLDPNGGASVTSSLVNTDKGLGVDPNG